MIRLNIVVEGQTEEVFVNKLLKPHLAAFNVVPVPRLIFTGKKYGRVFRGGVTRYHNFKWDLVLWMREDRKDSSFFTTMLDLYGLPYDFPGQIKVRSSRDPYQKVRTLEKAMERDFNEPRFIPYIQLHEFETLLLAQPQRFSAFFINNKERVRGLSNMVDEFPNPEYIDQGERTAPSKRIASFFPAYSRMKAVAGPFIAGAIGLETMRKQCPHFNGWLEILEGLNSSIKAID